MGKKKLGVKSLKTWIWKSNFKTGKPRKLHTGVVTNDEISKEKVVCGMMRQKLPREPLTLWVQDWGIPFPTESSPLPCTWLRSGSGWSFCYKNCFTPEPLFGHAVRGVTGEVENCRENRQALWKGSSSLAFKTYLSVPTVGSCGKESLISISYLYIHYFGVHFAQCPES